MEALVTGDFQDVSEFQASEVVDINQTFAASATAATLETGEHDDKTDWKGKLG